MKVALLYPGDRAMRERSDPAESRFAPLFEAFRLAGIPAQPAVYHDDFCDEVEAQLRGVDVVQAWCNPIEGGRRRDTLDAMLRRVAGRGVFVSAHPDAILALGTKDVLLAVRDLPFGSDVHRIGSLAQLQADLPQRLAQGPRVLKQYRGHSGMGVFRIERADGERVRVRPAQRGSEEETMDLEALCERLAPYFEPAAGGHMVDQAWQPRIAEGMVRAYLVGDRVAGFGVQAVNALHPEAPQPGQRLYHGPDLAECQRLRSLLESSWVELLRASVGLPRERLPLLWDCDFMLGAGDAYVLCEINVSSVSPFPPSAIPAIVAAVQARNFARQA
ncbi:Cj0069 family protein [Ramlibacter sp. PS4R-6]|uniref:Cj0069 family protein n=1 Tax=Ramlibacter sp. PS4R-6 TaxID=3133438 RepID=UPI003099A258